MVLSNAYYAGDNNDFQIYTNTDYQRSQINNVVVPDIQPMSLGVWYYNAASYDTETFQAYLDSTLYGDISASYTSTSTNYPFIIGSDADSSGTGSGNWLEGKIAEVRISNIARSANWIKATNYTLRDSIVYYYGIENYTPEGPAPNYYFHGWVKEKNIPVKRQLFLYKRTTGELLDKTISDEAGYYSLETPYTVEHFIVVLDDDEGVVYDPLISDKLIPSEK
jgi:hypothetical protein